MSAVIHDEGNGQREVRARWSPEQVRASAGTRTPHATRSSATRNTRDVRKDRSSEVGEEIGEENGTRRTYHLPLPTQQDDIPTGRVLAPPSVADVAVGCPILRVPPPRVRRVSARGTSGEERGAGGTREQGGDGNALKLGHGINLVVPGNLWCRPVRANVSSGGRLQVSERVCARGCTASYGGRNGDRVCRYGRRGWGGVTGTEGDRENARAR